MSQDIQQDLSAPEALSIIRTLLKQSQFNALEEVIFLESWLGKSYQEIALAAGYGEDHVRAVGSQVWSCLSEVLGERVSKKNIKLVIARLKQNSRTVAAGALEFPGSPVPIHSNFYVDRPPIEERAFAEILKPGSLTRIKAPNQMGKTSLVYRIIHYAKAQGFHTVFLNVQAADRSVLTNLDQFLTWLCSNISLRLNLEPRMEYYWNRRIGSKVSCTMYFEDYLLAGLDRPVVLVLDEVNHIFEYPELAEDFLPLLRFWYEEATQSKIWQKLRLIVVHSTEVYVPLNLNQSPFNVGLPLELPEFSQLQVQVLAQQHGLHQIDIEPLIRLVGGHPYLVRLALYHLAQGEISLEQLIEEAPTQAGVYRTHLRQHWELLKQRSELWAAFQRILNSTGVQLESTIAYQLESLGLIQLRGNRATSRYELYRLYFSSQKIED